MKPSQLIARVESSVAALVGRPTTREMELQRQLEDKRAFYQGATVNRLFSDWVMAPLPNDQELVWELRTLRTRSRDLGRNNPFLIRYFDLLEDNIVGANGIGLRGQLADDAGEPLDGPNRKLRDAWNRWCDQVSLSGRYGMIDFCYQSIVNAPQDGEIFVRKHIGREYPSGLALEFVDPDLVDETYNVPRNDAAGTNEVRLSVEVDPMSRPVGYWCFREPYVYGSVDRNRYFVPADQMLHLGRTRRINATRHVPWAHGVMDALKMLDGLTEAELVASRAAAAKMGWLVQNNKDGASQIGEIGTDGRRNPIPMEATPGQIAIAPPGYTFESWDPQHPTTAFPTFHAAMIRRVASGLGVSYTSLANDPGDANYSSTRTAMQAEQRWMRKVQRWFVRGFMQPVFEEWLKLAILTGDLDLPGFTFDELRRVKWELPGWEWIDPMKDVQATILAIDANLESEQSALAELGRDFDDVIRERKAAKQLIKAAGLEPPPPPVEPSGVQPHADTPTEPNEPQDAGSDVPTARPSRNGHARSRVVV